MTKIVACIPTRFYPPTLAPLLAGLTEDGVQTIVRPPEHPPRPAIYTWWQEMADQARELEPGAYIAMLNDDIILPRGTLPYLARALDMWPQVGVTYPDMRAWAGMPGRGYAERLAGPPPPLPKKMTLVMTHGGSFIEGGLTGFCFLMRPTMPKFDERYHWWYGDNQFDEDVWAAGYGVGRLEGVAIQHLQSESSYYMDEQIMKGLRRDDLRRWQEKHRVVDSKT